MDTHSAIGFIFPLETVWLIFIFKSRRLVTSDAIYLYADIETVLCSLLYVVLCLAGQTSLNCCIYSAIF